MVAQSHKLPAIEIETRCLEDEKSSREVGVRTRYDLTSAIPLF
jgi:hypothetical protein